MTTTETPPRERVLVVPLSDVEWRDSGDPERKGETTLRGHAAVFNSLSDDLGGFREIIEPGFFRAALRSKPDVRLLFNHDPNYVLGRTSSGTLELREDTRGLHVFARIDKTISWVADLRSSMQRGDIDQMSFAFTLREGGDDWAVAEDGTVVRTLRTDGADELFDTSVVTFPAYRHTDATMRSVLQDAISRGRVPVTVEQAIELASDEDEPAVTSSQLAVQVALSTEELTRAFQEGFESAFGKGSTEVAEETPGEERDAASIQFEHEHELMVDVPQDNDLLPEFQKLTRERRNEANESYLRLLKEHGLK